MRGEEGGQCPHGLHVNQGCEWNRGEGDRVTEGARRRRRTALAGELLCLRYATSCQCSGDIGQRTRGLGGGSTEKQREWKVSNWCSEVPSCYALPLRSAGAPRHCRPCGWGHAEGSESETVRRVPPRPVQTRGRCSRPARASNRATSSLSRSHIITRLGREQPDPSKGTEPSGSSIVGPHANLQLCKRSGAPPPSRTCVGVHADLTGPVPGPENLGDAAPLPWLAALLDAAAFFFFIIFQYTAAPTAAPTATKDTATPAAMPAVPPPPPLEAAAPTGRLLTMHWAE